MKETTNPFDFEPSKHLKSAEEELRYLGAKEALLLAMHALEQARSEALDADCPGGIKNPAFFDFEQIAGLTLAKMYYTMVTNVAWDEAACGADSIGVVETVVYPSAPSRSSARRDPRPKRNGGFVPQGKNKDGFVTVRLEKDDGTKVTELVHELVWKTFKGPIPPGFQVSHKNGNKEDNRLDNLYLKSL